MLNHLNTKFLTRRSDIIVSSTLSVTLTPVEDFVPTSLANMTPEDRDSWVEHRSRFRAAKVTQATLA